MTTNEETTTEKGQDPQSLPSRTGTTEPERSSPTTAAHATGQTGPPAEQRAAGEAPTTPASPTPEDAGSEVGWFSTEPSAGGPHAGDHSGTLSKQLSAERPGDEPAHDPDASSQPPSGVPDGHDLDTPETEGGGSVGPEDSTGSRETSGAGGSSGAGEPAAGASSRPAGPAGERSVGAGEPMEVAESSGAARAAGGVTGPEESLDSDGAREPVGPEASIGQENAPFGMGPAPGRQEPRSPELIEAGMVYLDPDPETGSPPSAAGWTERSAGGLGPQQGSSGLTNASGPEVGGVPHPVGDVTDSVGAPREAEHLEEGPEAKDLEKGGDVGEAAVPAEIGGAGSGGAGQPRGADEVVGTTEPGDDAEAVARLGATPGTGLSGDVGAAEPPDASGASGSEVGGPAWSTDGGEASSDSTVDPIPWSEPALPMAWPPGMAPPGRGESSSSSEDDQADSELPPQPDPSWPRLFGPSRTGDDTGGAGLLPEAGEAATRHPVEVGRQETRATAAENPHPERERVVLGPGGEGALRSSAEEPMGKQPVGEEPVGKQPVGSVQPQELQATSGVTPAGGQYTGRSAVLGMEPRRGDLEASDEMPVDGSEEVGAEVPVGTGEGAASSAASGESSNPATYPPPVLNVTTGESRAGSGPSDQPTSGRAGAGTADLALGPAAASAPEGGEGAARHANISTVIHAAEAGEVDLREAPAGPRGDDVSRETSADGGEGMDPGRQDEALEDEAAIAVRDAVSRAAAEAGVDVSRETDPMAADFAIDEPSAEETIDPESAARNARVTFRIHRESLNGIRRVLAVANQKGGVGKSTTAVNIGAYLALAGARVLVIDLDPQGNASTGLGLDHRDIEPSIYDVLTGEAATAAAIRATGVPNLHVLPSTIDLAGAEVELVSAMSRETRLRRALQSIDRQYDTILIDCPPSLGLLTVNALAAANELLIPIQCEYYALEGLGQLLRNVELVRANLNPELRIGGIVLTMYDGRTRLALQVVDEVRKHFTDVVYQTVVPRSVRLSEAPGYGLPIALYDPLSRGGIAYRDLTYELAERSGLLAPTGEGAS
jgi:chromosome partitioning protein